MAVGCGSAFANHIMGHDGNRPLGDRADDAQTRATKGDYSPWEGPAGECPYCWHQKENDKKATFSENETVTQEERVANRELIADEVNGEVKEGEKKWIQGGIGAEEANALCPSCQKPWKEHVCPKDESIRLSGPMQFHDVFTVGDRTYELVPFLKEGEESIIGEEMLKRAKGLGAECGEEDGKYILEHEKEIPESVQKKYLIFINWRNPDDPRDVAYLGYSRLVRRVK